MSIDWGHIVFALSCLFLFCLQSHLVKAKYQGHILQIMAYGEWGGGISVSQTHVVGLSFYIQKLLDL